MKNIVRRAILDDKGNVVSWEVLDTSGGTVVACSQFIRKLEGFAFSTKKRYVEAVCNFVDYLYECGILGCFEDGDTLPSRQQINEVIDAYIPFLLRGSKYSLEVLSSDPSAQVSIQWKIRVFTALNIEPCSRKSLDNVIAALNRFLRVSEALSHEANDIAEHHGINLPSEYSPLINAVDGFSRISSLQRAALRSSSLIGGVLRLHGAINRPAGISHPSKRKSHENDVKDFPVAYMDNLISAATSWRDRALWLLLLASGLRKSEALNLRWADIDYKNRNVYVLDPNNRRYGRFMTPEEKVRFKGRNVSWTYLWEPWRSKFFQALAEYRKREWRLPSDSNDFVFQILKVQDGQVGVPLALASDSATIEAFKRAVIKAGIITSDLEGNKTWTPHSLRHAYGVYMLNYIPIGPGVFGFSEVDVQSLMGHQSITSTRKYARRKKDILSLKLEYADKAALESMGLNLLEMPPPLAKSVRQLSSINHEAVTHD